MELPLPTIFCIGISNFMVSYWWTLIIGIFIFAWAFNKWKSTDKGQRRWHSITLAFPVFGNIVRMINVSRFCSTLTTLMGSGVPILISLKIVKNLIPNVLIKDAIEGAREAVQEGASMTIPLKDSQQFPSMVTHMISLGEKSGELEEMLGIIADNYEDQVDSKINGLTSLLEPIMIVFLGATVFFIVISVILPMMQLNSVR